LVLPIVTQVTIFAGGLATRLGELTRYQPKSLLKFQGEFFIEHQIEQIRRQGIRDIIICTGHLGEQIQRNLGDGSRYDVNITYSHENEPLGTGGALKNAEKRLADVFFTIYGDSYLSIDFQAVLAQFLANDALAMMTVYKNRDLYDKSNVSVKDGRVTGYSKNGRTPDMVYIDYGAQVFRKEALGLIPENRYYILEDLFKKLVDQQQLLAYEVNERFYEIGSMQGIEEFDKYLRGKQ
jgi:NDP-sugar pyrophosphorylase family protein